MFYKFVNLLHCLCQILNNFVWCHIFFTFSRNLSCKVCSLSSCFTFCEVVSLFGECFIFFLIVSHFIHVWNFLQSTLFCHSFSYFRHFCYTFFRINLWHFLFPSTFFKIISTFCVRHYHDFQPSKVGQLPWQHGIIGSIDAVCCNKCVSLRCEGCWCGG